jgi:hypothetical protein
MILITNNYYENLTGEILHLKYANKDLFEKIDGIWSPKFTPGEDFVI